MNIAEISAIRYNNSLKSNTYTKGKYSNTPNIYQDSSVKESGKQISFGALKSKNFINKEYAIKYTEEHIQIARATRSKLETTYLYMPGHSDDEVIKLLKMRKKTKYKKLLDNLVTAKIDIPSRDCKKAKLDIKEIDEILKEVDSQEFADFVNLLILFKGSAIGGGYYKYNLDHIKYYMKCAKESSV